MNKAGLERNENIFRFTDPKGRPRNRLGDAVRWPTPVPRGGTVRVKRLSSANARHRLQPLKSFWSRAFLPRRCWVHSRIPAATGTQKLESCRAYRGETAPGGGFAAGLEGSANG